MITVNTFTPSTEVLGTDAIASADDKIRTVMDEAGNYLETETQNAVTQMETQVDDKLNSLASSGDTVYSTIEVDQKLAEKLNATDIKDNLTSPDTDKPLSANQGKVLKDLLDTKQSISTTASNVLVDGTVALSITPDATETSPTTTANYTAGQHILDSSTSIMYDCILNSTSGELLTNVTYFTVNTTNTLDITSGVFTYTDGKASNGYNRKANTFTGSIDFTGVSDGLKWLAKDLDTNTFNFLDYKPKQIGLYDKVSADDNRYVFDVDDGKWYSTTGGELVTNGTFDTDVSGWTYATALMTWSSGVVDYSRNNAEFSDQPKQPISFIAGVTYGVSIDITTIASDGHLTIITFANDGTTIVNNITGVSYGSSTGTFTFTFTASANASYLMVGIADSFTATMSFDNISVYKKQATLDTPIATPLSFLPNPIQVTSATPQYIDYSDELATNVMNSLSVGSLEVTDGFDLGQTWQDITASRTTGVTYTNTTGKPIMVLISYSSDGNDVLFYINEKIQSSTTEVAAGAAKVSISMVIPNGSTYNITASATLSYWSELR